MKSFFSNRPRYKAAFMLIVMVVLLLSGVLIERHFFREVDYASTSLYEDRLMPATFVYQLADLTHQRYRLVEKMYIGPDAGFNSVQEQELNTYRQETQQYLDAFMTTYLVKAESACLARLQTALMDYDVHESRMWEAPSMAQLVSLEGQLDLIRAELLELSSIQVSVGKALLTDSEHTVASANVLSNLQVIILIICCLLAQFFILNAKTVRSPISQQPNLN